MTSSALKILVFTKYARNGASSRYRFFQYLPWLERAGIECTVMPLFDDAYLDHLYQANGGSRKTSHIFRALWGRVRALRMARHFDAVIVEKEILPYLPALPERWLNWLNVPYIADYDDALFHQYDLHKRRWIRHLLGDKIAQVMRRATLVNAGNTYLGDYARRAGAKQVEIIPTVVDLDRYPEKQSHESSDDTFTIGWIGSPSTAPYLQAIAPALAKVCRGGRARVRLIGSGKVDLPGVPVEILAWHEGSEVEALRRFDVGIMPLPDEPWEHGKCGLKLIQYMACGLPVIASPVGVNSSIVESNTNGFLANTNEDWISALMTLMNNKHLCDSMGRQGRQKVEQSYSLQVSAPRLVTLLKSIGRTQ